MLLYIGKFEDLEKYGFKKSQDWSNTYDKCIDGYFKYVEIDNKELETRDRVSKFMYGFNNIRGRIRLVIVDSNYQSSPYATDEKCKEYIMDLILDGLVVECDDYVFNTLSRVHKLEPNFEYEDTPRRKCR